MNDLPDDLIHEFKVAALAALAELRQLQEAAVAPGTMSRLVRLSHQLKGSAGSYGFPKISTAAGLVEKSLAAEVPTRLAKLVAQLELATKGMAAPPALSVSEQAPVEPVAAAPAVATPAGPPPVILFGEDDPMVVALVKDRLEREGFQVRHLVNGNDILAAASAEPIRLVILDAKLPGLDGFDILTRLRKLPAYAETPIVLLTALTGAQDAVRAFELGANDYIRKPFSPAELIARIKNLTKPPR